MDRYRNRKALYVAKHKKYISKSEIKKINKSFNKFLKSLRFKKLYGNIDNVIMKTLVIIIIILILLMMMNIEKLGVLEHYLKK